MTPDIFFYSIIFLFGLIIGSFLNCIIYRLEIGQGFLSGRSYCPECKHVLTWQDLIPILSFMLLKGKCRYCEKKISKQYPLVELATGILFLSIFNFQSLLITSYLLLIVCSLIIIFIYDLKHYIIPDEIIYPAIGTALIYNFINPHLLNTILAAFLASGFFLSIVLISRGKWMGLGDVKLAFFMGLFLSWPNILTALFGAFFIGAIIGIGLIILGKKTLKSEVPFGPFLVIGTFISLFWGQKIINWYFNLITI